MILKIDIPELDASQFEETAEYRCPRTGEMYFAGSFRLPVVHHCGPSEYPRIIVKEKKQCRPFANAVEAATVLFSTAELKWHCLVHALLCVLIGTLFGRMLWEWLT